MVLMFSISVCGAGVILYLIYHSRRKLNRGKTKQTREESIVSYDKLIRSSIRKVSLQDYEGALEDISIALEQKPYVENLYFQRANIKEVLSDFTGAKSDYTKAIMLKDDYDLAYLRRGMLKAREKDFAGARKDLKRALELSSELSEAHRLIQNPETVIMENGQSTINVAGVLIKSFPEACISKSA